MRDRSRHLDGTGLTSLLLNQSKRSLVKSIQVVNISLSGLSATATINAVNVNNAVILPLGRTSAVSNNEYHASTLRVALTDATTVTATRSNSGAPVTLVVAAVVIEFWPGVIRRVQRGTIALAAASSNTAAITEVNAAKAFVTNLGHEASSATFNSQTQTARVTLTNSTTVTADAGAAATLTVGYQVVEFY